MADEITVPLFDLKQQYAALRDEIREAIEPIMESQFFILGPAVEELERDIAAYCDTKHAVGCASGSDAILLALLGLGIKYSDPPAEVICPSYTFFATGGYISRAGAKPVFAEIDPLTYNLDPDSVRRAAKKCRNLKAIMPVHLYGQCADMDALLEIAAELDASVIEDAAQAIGAMDRRGKPAGSRGTIGCFSFFPTKNLGAFGDAGIVTTNDDDLAHRMRILRVHGGEPKYYHKYIGLNSRLDTLQAAVLRVKLRYLDEWTEKRQRNARFYDRAFAEAGATTTAEGLRDDGFPLCTPCPVQEPAHHIYNQYCIRVPASLRDPLREHLRQSRIGTEIYYPVPLHLQECFADLGYSKGDFPVTEAAADESIALPIFPELTEDQLSHVASTIIDFLSAACNRQSGAATQGLRT